MKEDFSEEAKKLIGRHKKENISYAKPINFLLPRIKATKEEIEKDIINYENLEFTELIFTTIIFKNGLPPVFGH